MLYIENNFDWSSGEMDKDDHLVRHNGFLKNIKVKVFEKKDEQRIVFLGSKMSHEYR